jgi:hypothetical protein
MAFSPGRLRLRIAEGAMCARRVSARLSAEGRDTETADYWAAAASTRRFPGHRAAPMLERHFLPHGVQEFNLARNSRADLDHSGRRTRRGGIKGARERDRPSGTFSQFHGCGC